MSLTLDVCGERYVFHYEPEGWWAEARFSGWEATVAACDTFAEAFRLAEEQVEFLNEGDCR